MRIVGVIPARMGSSRYPGKPLVPILDRPMVEHVFLRAKLASTLDQVYVATCDEEISDIVRGFGGQCMMTSPKHQRASDRTAEVAESLSADVVVMIQGDEPMARPEMIDVAVRGLLESEGAACVNLAGPIQGFEELADPNTVKVVVGRDGTALYFSRQPIGLNSAGSFPTGAVRRQVCIIPFRREALLTYAQLTATPLEEAESIDMLRLLEHGYRVHTVTIEDRTYPVDTPADRDSVEELMSDDPVLSRYAEVKLLRERDS